MGGLGEGEVSRGGLVWVLWGYLHFMLRFYGSDLGDSKLLGSYSSLNVGYCCLIHLLCI